MFNSVFFDSQLEELEISSDRKYLSKTFEVNPDQKQVFNTLLLKLKEINHPNIINILDYTVKNDNIYTIKIDYFETCIANEVKIRQKSLDYFNENELWSILKESIFGMIYLDSIALPHRNIELSYLKMTMKKSENNSFQIKILHPSLISLFFMSKNQLEIERNYYSPEELINLKYRDSNIEIDYFKSDVFCLGLSLLEISTLFSLNSCFDWQNMFINYEFIMRKLLIVHNRYSKHLAFIIKNMLIVDEKKRMFFYELNALMKKEEEKIIEEIKNKKIKICYDCKNDIYEKYSPEKGLNSQYNDENYNILEKSDFSNK